jgi:hypothetical protein
MEETQVKSAYDDFNRALNSSLVPYYSLLVLLFLGTGIFLLKTDWVEQSEFFIFVGFFPAVILSWVGHKLLMENPVMNPLKNYTDKIRTSKLSGDDLVRLKALPTNTDIRKIWRYNRSLQKTITVELFTCLATLDFSPGIEQEMYKDTFRFIETAKK